MGEYAEMALDEGFSAWGGGEDDEDGEISVSRFSGCRLPQPKVCRRCGEDGLWWKDTPQGWRLHAYSEEEGWEDKLRLHVCPSASSEPVEG